MTLLQKLIFVGLHAEPVAVILDHAAFLILLVHIVLSLLEVWKDFLLYLHFQRVVALGLGDNLENIDLSGRLNNALKAVEVKDAGAALGHFDHIGQDAL